ncbi:TPA: hypothetical protein ACH6OQ_004729, partial [Escherichia coli]
IKKHFLLLLFFYLIFRWRFRIVFEGKLLLVCVVDVCGWVCLFATSYIAHGGGLLFAGLIDLNSVI